MSGECSNYSKIFEFVDFSRNNRFDHGGSEEHRGRLATGRSQDSLEIEKLSLSIWYSSKSSVWLTKSIRDTWKVVKGISSFNFDSIFDSDL